MALIGEATGKIGVAKAEAKEAKEFLKMKPAAAVKKVKPTAMKTKTPKAASRKGGVYHEPSRNQVKAWTGRKGAGNYKIFKYPVGGDHKPNVRKAETWLLENR